MPERTCRTGLCLVPVLLAGALAAQPWTVEVNLVPHAQVVGAGPVVISFGLPLPPSLLTDAANVKVLGPRSAEIAAHVASLGPWRRIPPESLLCAGLPRPTQPGIRSVLVQFTARFAKPGPHPVQIVLGEPRTLFVTKGTPVRETWRLVDDGTYRAASKIYEPRVYALLPPHWLACSGLTTMASVSGDHRFLDAFDRGQVNFFRPVVNDFSSQPDRAALLDYLGDNEPWLYDRAQSFYSGYVRTGQLSFLREAHRATQHYMGMLHRAGDCPGLRDEQCRGYLSLKSQPGAGSKDPKYSYAECLATLYWLTGDPEPLQRIPDVASANRYGVSLTRPVTDMHRFFTERNWANALLAALFEYEVTGDTAAADHARRGIEALLAMQRRPIGGKPANGCFNHNWEQEGELGFSPWMSSLLAHALLRAYHTLGDPRIPEMLAALGECIVSRGLYLPANRGEPQFWMPRYGAASYGEARSLDGDCWSDYEHAIDAAYVTAVGAYFSRDPARTSALAEATRRLLQTHTFAQQQATSAGGGGQPLYRVRPPRKYAWWFKNSGAIGWALAGPTRFSGGARRN